MRRFINGVCICIVNLVIWILGIVWKCGVLVALWALILCCGNMRMCGVIVDFLVLLLVFVFLLCLSVVMGVRLHSPFGKGREVQGEWEVVWLHSWGPWSMGSIVCHFHSYYALGVVREKWLGKEVNEVWVWRKLKLLVVCGGGCLWSPERVW